MVVIDRTVIDGEPDANFEARELYHVTVSDTLVECSVRWDQAADMLSEEKLLEVVVNNIKYRILRRRNGRE